MAKTLVAWFSHPGGTYMDGAIRNLEHGNCERLAQAITDALGCDQFHIVEKDPYPADYQACIDHARADKNANARPELETPAPDMTTYDTMVLIYPNWWGTMPMPVYTFLESVDTAGLAIAPLCSNEGSGMGSSERDLRTTCPKADLRKGLSILGHETDENLERAVSWARGAFR
jgi:flavodoxin